MRNYSIVQPSFWAGTTGRQIKAMGSGHQLIALYLLTCPSANMIGLYYLPLVTMAHQTNMSLEAVRSVLQGLADIGFAFYDENEEAVWVTEMAKFQIGERLDPRDLQCKGVQKALKPMMKSVYYPSFWKRYHTDFHLPDSEPPALGSMTSKSNQSPYQGASKAHQAPLKGASETLPSQDQFQNQVQVHGQEPTQDQSLGAGLPGDLVGSGLVHTHLGSGPVGKEPGLGGSLAEPPEDWVDFGEEAEMGEPVPVVPVQQSPESTCVVLGPCAASEPSALDGTVHPEVQQIFDAWNRACVEGTPYEQVQENQKPSLTPMVMECLSDPEWKAKFIRFIEQMHNVPFYAGKVPSTIPGKAPFAPFLRWIVSNGPSFINNHLAQIDSYLKRLHLSSTQVGGTASNGVTSGRMHPRTASDNDYLHGLVAKSASQVPPVGTTPNALVTKKQNLINKEQGA